MDKFRHSNTERLVKTEAAAVKKDLVDVGRPDTAVNPFETLISNNNSDAVDWTLI